MENAEGVLDEHWGFLPCETETDHLLQGTEMNRPDCIGDVYTAARCGKCSGCGRFRGAHAGRKILTPDHPYVACNGFVV